MMHVCIFPTWECQLNCVYCSIRNSKIDRAVASVPWQEWAKALSAVLSPGSIVDIAGGEPLMYEGLVDMLHALGGARLRWAITTNAKASAAIDRLYLETPKGATCINVSDHNGNPEAHDNVIKLRRAGYQVNVHRVDHPAAGTHEPDARVITYQDWLGDKAVDGIARKCTAGLDHWVAGPNGDLWRCVVALETGQPSLGNLFTREVKKTGAECDFGCSACYTEDPQSWMVEMREVAYARSR
jgi:sulfatase maturation enzyme AslB (radical SAM superfamily)